MTDQALAAELTAAVEAAHRVADTVLAPAAATVDAATSLPPGHRAALAEAGLYGVAAWRPGEDPMAGRFTAVAEIVEILGAGCLATALVWLQHVGPLITAATNDRLRDRWLADLSSGRVTAGIGLAGIRPGATSPLRAKARAGGHVLTGQIPWVSGWGAIGLLQVAALGADDTVVDLLLDAADGPTLTADPMPLTAARASNTVRLTFTEHAVAADRFVGTRELAEVRAGDAHGVALNGFLALGLVRRAIGLLRGQDEAAVAARLAAAAGRCRDTLLAATGSAVSGARAAASELALRAAAAAATRAGSGSALAGSDGDRLTREAALLLVFASRPPIRAHLLGRLAP